ACTVIARWRVKAFLDSPEGAALSDRFLEELCHSGFAAHPAGKGSPCEIPLSIVAPRKRGSRGPLLRHRLPAPRFGRSGPTPGSTQEPSRGNDEKERQLVEIFSI